MTPLSLTLHRPPRARRHISSVSKPPSVHCLSVPTAPKVNHQSKTAAAQAFCMAAIIILLLPLSSAFAATFCARADEPFVMISSHEEVIRELRFETQGGIFLFDAQVRYGKAAKDGAIGAVVQIWRNGEVIERRDVVLAKQRHSTVSILPLSFFADDATGGFYYVTAYLLGSPGDTVVIQSAKLCWIGD